MSVWSRNDETDFQVVGQGATITAFRSTKGRIAVANKTERIVDFGYCLLRKNFGT